MTGSAVPRTWAVLPGLALAPSDYDGVVAALRDAGATDVRVLDSWEVPVTEHVGLARAALGLEAVEPGTLGLVGHSSGGTAAVEWALRHGADLASLVLLDPSPPDAAGAPLVEPGAPLERAGRVVVGAAGAWVGRAGPAVRRAVLGTWYHAPDRVDPDERAWRFGSAAGWTTVWDQLAQSWGQERRVAHLLADEAATWRARGVPTSLLVAYDLRTPARVLRAARSLGDRLGARVLGLPGQTHLFPQARPEVVAAAARGGTPVGATRPRDEPLSGASRA